MKRYVFPEDIDFVGASVGGMTFDNKEELKKAINFLIEVNCNFTYKDNSIILIHAELASVYLDPTRVGWDYLILTVYEKVA